MTDRFNLARLAVLAALFSVVDVASKALAPHLARVKEVRALRGFGLGWVDAFRVSGMHPISGGASITEGPHTAEFLLTEANGWRSREAVTVLSGQDLAAGAVVGGVDKGVGRVSVPTVVGTGNGTISGVSAGPEVEVGNYVLTCITAAANAGTFSVTTPDGTALPNATVAVPYVSDHIRFTINDGSTDFIVGDAFTVVVSTTVPAVVGTGNGVISAITLGPVAKTGNYRFEVIAAGTNAATIELFDPDGESLGTEAFSGSGAAATFTTPQINAVITDGSTDFAVGDVFNVSVFSTQPEGGKVVAWDPTAVDGRNVAVGILYDAVDATAADAKGVIVTRDAEVRGASLTWASAIAAAQKDSAITQLRSRGVIVR